MAKETADKRFAGITNDPRFRRPAAKKSKTVIDSRFKKVLTDERFRGSSDKNPRGFAKKDSDLVVSSKKKKNVNEDMKKFYHLAEDDEALESGESASENEGGFRWDAVSSSDEGEEIENEETTIEADPEDVLLGDSTDRIGIMNCNWDHVSASDLFVLIQSFLDDNAPGRKLLSITIHKSEFGIERMEREAMYGPLIEGMPQDAEEDDSLKTKDELKKLDSLRTAAIRNYEQLKKRYFFAIGQFDSINTACIVYDELDGVSSGFVSESLDLRFIPEDVVAPSRDPVSFADKRPVDYSPPNIEVGALTMQHSKVVCSWDDDTPEHKILMKKLTPAQIGELDLAAYLESSEDDSEVDVEGIRRALLGDNDTPVSDKSDESAVEGDMEMSFSRGVESAGKDIAKRVADTGRVGRGQMSQWEQYLEKKKEAGRTKKAARREKLETQKLERAANAKKHSKADAHSDDEHVEIAPLDDARLAKLSNPKFAMDPTHPSFKKRS